MEGSGLPMMVSSGATVAAAGGGLWTNAELERFILGVILYGTPGLVGLLGLAWATVRLARRSRREEPAPDESEAGDRGLMAFFAAWALAGLVLVAFVWTDRLIPLPTLVTAAIFIGAPFAAALAVLLAVERAVPGRVRPIAMVSVAGLAMASVGPAVWMLRDGGFSWGLGVFLGVVGLLMLEGWRMAGAEDGAG